MTAFGDLITDFATRTLVNLDLVKDAAKETDNEAYDVTQLWNSLLGLVVAPREQDIEVFPRTKLVPAGERLAGYHNCGAATVRRPVGACERPAECRCSFQRRVSR